MKISPICTHANIKSQPNFAATLRVTDGVKELMHLKCKGDLFEAAADIFAKKLRKVDYDDDVVLSCIPDVGGIWTPDRIARLKTFGTEDVLMTMNNYHESGFWVNPRRLVDEVADDLFDTYTNLTLR